MADYQIMVDSACDVNPELLREWGVQVIDMSLLFDGEEESIPGLSIPAPVFYQRLREGAMAKTAAVNSEDFRDTFEAHLREGRDVLYLSFSSGLSSTFHTAELIAEDLREQYPERKVCIVDSLSASSGYGLLLYLMVLRKQEGMEVEALQHYAEETRFHVCHWFTVDDLNHLKRGGRLSSAAAILGTVLQVKPVLHMDNEGHLIGMSKARGRKKAIQALADAYEATALNREDPVFISHSDCPEDVAVLRDIMKERFGVEVMMDAYIGPMIGAHVGPGTLSLFFVGSER